MTTVARCGSLDQALLLRSLLEGCGVKAYIPDELSASGSAPAFAPAQGGIRLQVEDEDAASARSVLKANAPQDVV